MKLASTALTVRRNPRRRTSNVAGGGSSEDRILAALIVLGLATLIGMLLWVASLRMSLPASDYLLSGPQQTLRP